MSDLDPAELSAFLDGELDAIRAAEVAAIIASDEDIRLEYELLKREDLQWRAIARSAAFRPRLRWTHPGQAFPTWVAAPLLFILTASVAGRLTGAMAESLVLNTVSLLVLVCVLVATWSKDHAEVCPTP